VAIGVVLGCQGILLGQRVGKRHGRISDNAAIAVILLNQDKNMGYDRNFVRRRWIGSASAASELNPDKEKGR